MDDGLDLLGQYGFCPYCLAIKNYTTTVLARSSQRTDIAPPEVCTDPVALSRWLHDKLGEHAGEVRFEIGDTTNRFVPVAFINGTPVCPVDLWWLTDARNRR